jgi:hypothetical protein
MLRLELKRILKTRSTWWLLAIAMALCLIFAVWSVQSVTCAAYENGTEKTVRGMEAYQLNRARYASLEGEITPERIRDAVLAYRSATAQYEDAVPPEVAARTVDPYHPAYIWLMRAFSSEDGRTLTVSDIAPEQAMDFYKVRLDSLRSILTGRYENAPQVVRYAMERAPGNGTHDRYRYGIGSTDAFDYLGVCAFLIAGICVVMTAPVFSSDYASGADDILRCARRGRGTLALAKLCSAAMLSFGAFALCTGAFLAIVYAAFGFGDTTNLWLLYAAYNPERLSAMDSLKWILASGLLSLLAMTGFTLFLSARMKNPSVVLAIALAVLMIPSLLMIVEADGNLLNWIRFCLPSGGLSLSGALTSELYALRFLWIGNFVTWSPYVIFAAAAAQIPIWFLLSARAYCKHEAA